MKTVSLVIFVVIQSIVLFAQNITGIVKYNQVIRNSSDTTNYTEIEMELIFNTQKTIYKVTPKKLSGKLHGFSESKAIFYKANPSADRIGTVYKDFVLNTVSAVEPAMQERIFMRDTMTAINWKIGKETKTLGELVCQRAEADVRGRHWTVWFAPQISSSSGPWKLYGLPGLILEASDHTRNIKYLFESIQIPAPANTIIEPLEPDTDQRVMNRNQFVKQLIINRDNYIKMIDADSNYPGIKTTMKIGSIEIFSEMEEK